MKCPHDGTALSARVYEADIQVDECESCGGMWLDKGELEQIQETIEHDHSAELRAMPDTTVAAYREARDLRPAGSLRCPSCEAEMSAREYAYCSQIWVDVCPDCEGVWLEAGELRQLEVFFERAKSDTRQIRKSFWASLRELVFAGVVPED